MSGWRIPQQSQPRQSWPPGWVTAGLAFGAEAAVVRNWDGVILAEVVLGPGCRVVRLPTPLKRPDPLKAITSGDFSDEYEDDPLGDDEQYRDAF